MPPVAMQPAAPPPPIDAVEAAGSAPGVPVAAAEQADAQAGLALDVAPVPPVAALPDTGAASAITPGRLFLLLAPVLAFAGVLLRLAFKLAVARRRQVYIDPRRLDWRGTSAHEPVAPRLGNMPAPPSVPEDDTEAFSYDETLRQILRTLERRAA